MNARGRHAAPRRQPRKSGRAGKSAFPASRIAAGARPRAINAATVAGLAIIVAMIIFCFAGPVFYRPDLAQVNLALSNRPPGGQYLLGTDQYGIDILGRLMTGGPLFL